MISGTEGYAEAAPSLLRTRLAFAERHAPILHLIPQAPAQVLDIGAGAGHDAATLAEFGHCVVAAEPTPELLRGAVTLYGSRKVRWLDDGLPRLEKVVSLGRRFAFVLISAVWMHLDKAQRQDAMPVVAKLLEACGIVAISLRHGIVPQGRRMFEVSAAETIALAEQAGLSPILHVHRGSAQAVNQAAGVTWTFLAFQRGP